MMNEKTLNGDAVSTEEGIFEEYCLVYKLFNQLEITSYNDLDQEHKDLYVDAVKRFVEVEMFSDKEHEVLIKHHRKKASPKPGDEEATTVTISNLSMLESILSSGYCRYKDEIIWDLVGHIVSKGAYYIRIPNLGSSINCLKTTVFRAIVDITREMNRNISYTLPTVWTDDDVYLEDGEKVSYQIADSKADTEKTVLNREIVKDIIHDSIDEFIRGNKAHRMLGFLNYASERRCEDLYVDIKCGYPTAIRSVCNSLISNMAVDVCYLNKSVIPFKKREKDVTLSMVRSWQDLGLKDVRQMVKSKGLAEY